MTNILLLQFMNWIAQDTQHCVLQGFAMVICNKTGAENHGNDQAYRLQLKQEQPDYFFSEVNDMRKFDQAFTNIGFTEINSTEWRRCR